MTARVLLLCVLACTVASAQDTPRDLTPLALIQLDRGAAGARARVQGLRYRGWRKPVLRTYREGLDGKLFVKSTSLTAQLEQDFDIQGATLVPYRSNVVVEGTLRWGGDELGVLLEVDSLVLQADDATRLRETLSDLDDGDRAGRLLLRTQARARVLTAYDPADRKALRDFDAELTKTLEAANTQRLGALPAAAEAYLEAGTSEGDLAVLAQAWAHPGTPPALKERLSKALTSDLRARYFEGVWYGPEEYKHALGFRQHPTPSGKLVWMSTLHAEFSEAVLEVIALLALSESSPFGSSIGAMLERAVKAGNVLRGMSKDHVVRIQRDGRPYLPESINRRVDPAANETSPEVVWEQWLMPDGMRVYFYNGLVCSNVPGR